MGIHTKQQLPVTPAIEAMVRYNGTGYHRHRLRDIRLEGAFVEMGNVRVLRKDSPVQVVFVHRQAGSSHTHRLEAKVAWVETDGAQLHFCTLDEPAIQALRAFQGAYPYPPKADGVTKLASRS